MNKRRNWAWTREREIPGRSNGVNIEIEIARSSSRVSFTSSSSAPSIYVRRGKAHTYVSASILYPPEEKWSEPRARRVRTSMDGQLDGTSEIFIPLPRGAGIFLFYFFLLPFIGIRSNCTGLQELASSVSIIPRRKTTNVTMLPLSVLCLSRGEQLSEDNELKKRH